MGSPVADANGGRVDRRVAEVKVQVGEHSMLRKIALAPKMGEQY